MNWTEKTGDLLVAFENGEVDVIAHQVNCFGIAKSGLAPVLFKWFPWAAEPYFSDDRSVFDKLGTVIFAERNDQFVFNLYGQYHHDHDNPLYGTNTGTLTLALSEMKNVLVEKNRDFKIGFPLIGCGLAGGDWETVCGIIKVIFSDTDFDIAIYRLKG